MKLIIDQQFPPLLAQWLRGQGWEASHVFEIGLTNRPDFEIWNLSVREKSVVISRDSDFLNFAKQKPGGRLVWVRLGNCTNPELIATFQRLWPAIALRLQGPEQIVEVRA